MSTYEYSSDIEFPSDSDSDFYDHSRDDDDIVMAEHNGGLIEEYHPAHDVDEDRSFRPEPPENLLPPRHAAESSPVLGSSGLGGTGSLPSASEIANAARDDEAVSIGSFPYDEVWSPSASLSSLFSGNHEQMEDDTGADSSRIISEGSQRTHVVPQDINRRESPELWEWRTGRLPRLDDIVPTAARNRSRSPQRPQEGAFLPYRGGLGDELIEMELERSREARREVRRDSIARRLATPMAPPALRRQQTVIDLTEEPDSPVLLSRPQPPPPQTRNPRRQMSASQRMPSLTRSDGSILAGTPVIDLTGESDEREQPPARPTARPQRHHRHEHHHHQHHHHHIHHPRIPQRSQTWLASFTQQIANGSILNHLIPRSPVLEIVGFPPQPPPRMPMDNPLQGNPVMFDYAADGFGGGGPGHGVQYVPPAPAREGFTRDTGEDKVVVCASCDEELKYDPENVEEPPAKGAKKPRTKKDREEHHFWAVTACGHVSISFCFPEPILLVLTPW
jgi:hypothetical protein